MQPKATTRALYKVNSVICSLKRHRKLNENVLRYFLKVRGDEHSVTNGDKLFYMPSVCCDAADTSRRLDIPIQLLMSVQRGSGRCSGCRLVVLQLKQRPKLTVNRRLENA